MRRWWISIVVVVGLLAMGGRVLAHANLTSANPQPNAILDKAPAEIRLGFTEPLEKDFSRILLRDKDGNIIETPPSQVDANDHTQLVLVPGNLPDGLYTVSWRVLSATDGHATQGSYAIIVGAATGGFGTTTNAEAIIPADGSIIRWFNLISLALAVGGLGFWMFVWTPAVPEKQATVERRMTLLIWIGWVLVGISGALLLVLQYSIATGYPLLGGIDGDSLNSLVTDTRFGQLWLTRMALWAGLGGALWFANGDRWFQWVALMLGGAILAINSLFSHASATFDANVAMLADWLHLLAMALWVGGLAQFANVIAPVRKEMQSSAPVLSRLVGHFTNFARVSIAALTITGLYSAWLQVGTVDGLLNTGYGQALLIKVLLVIPVIAIAAVNMVYTHSRLESGEEIWGGRLRGLVGVEIAITLGMLLMVGMMTSTAPARATLAQRAANPPPPQPQPLVETLTTAGNADITTDDLNIELSIAPGWIGENTFTLKITDPDGQPVDDVTLIRMRFESQTQNLGESELRPTAQGGGIYTISGANLSVPGLWRIRTTVQRPDKFDALADFKPDVPAIPEPPPIVPVPPPDAPLPNRTLALLLAGVGLLALGGYFLGENRGKLLRASVLLAVGMLGLGGVFLITAMQGTVVASDAPAAYQAEPTAPVRLVVNSDVALPYLITQEGNLYLPDVAKKTWSRLALDAKIHDVYVDNQKTIWAATDKGVFSYEADMWTQIADVPVTDIDMMHGYLFALGNGSMTRIPAGGAELDRVRQLNIPINDQPANGFVMLGNHTHIIENGDKLYLSPDLGLSWSPVDFGEPIESIAVDVDGNLLATTMSALYVWHYTDRTWSNGIALPEGDPYSQFVTFQDHLYAVAGGKLYLEAGSSWRLVGLPLADNAYLTSLAYQYPRALWVLDAANGQVLSSEDGQNWTAVDVQLED